MGHIGDMLAPWGVQITPISYVESPEKRFLAPGKLKRASR